MVNLYTLPTYVVVLFIGVILCLFLANSVLYYYLMPQAQFRQLGRKCKAWPLMTSPWTVTIQAMAGG